MSETLTLEMIERAPCAVGEESRCALLISMGDAQDACLPCFGREMLKHGEREYMTPEQIANSEWGFVLMKSIHEWNGFWHRPVEGKDFDPIRMENLKLLYDAKTSGKRLTYEGERLEAAFFDWGGYPKTNRVLESVEEWKDILTSYFFGHRDLAEKVESAILFGDAKAVAA